MRQIAALAVPLLLLASAARAADPTPWGQAVPGLKWFGASLTKGAGKVTCWVHADAYAAAGDKAVVAMYQLTPLGKQGDLKVYSAAPCPVAGITKMGSGAQSMLMIGDSMLDLQPGVDGRMQVLDAAHASDFKTRIKPSWDAMKRFVGS